MYVCTRERKSEAEQGLESIASISVAYLNRVTEEATSSANVSLLYLRALGEMSAGAPILLRLHGFLQCFQADVGTLLKIRPVHIPFRSLLTCRYAVENINEAVIQSQ
jgi:hypothetical protein